MAPRPTPLLRPTAVEPGARRPAVPEAPEGPSPLREPPPDGSLVARALAGDRWAEEALFRRHVGGVIATAARLLGDRIEAEDVAQETFATALDRLATLREPDAFAGWLVRIAVSKAHRVLRRRRWRRVLGGHHDAGDDDGLAGLAAADADPDTRAELALLDRALRELPPAERIAWTLRYVEGRTLEGVAEACDVSLATAKRRIAAARARVERHVAVGEVRRG